MTNYAVLCERSNVNKMFLLPIQILKKLPMLRGKGCSESLSLVLSPTLRIFDTSEQKIDIIKQGEIFGNIATIGTKRVRCFSPRHMCGDLVVESMVIRMTSICFCFVLFRLCI